MKPRIVITGASGFLGGHCVLNASHDIEVFAMYHAHRPTEEYGVNWIEGNLLDEMLAERLLHDIHPQAIIHNAALSKPDDCESNPDLANELNVEATDRFASAAKKYGAKLIYLSTDIVYDGEHAPYSEASPAEPICIYGRTKVLGEKQILSGSERNLVVRPAVMYGAKGIFGSNFALAMIERWQRNESTPVFIDQVRSHVSVKWLAKALFEFAFDNSCGTVNLGGAEPSSRAEFGHRLAEYLGFPDSLLTETSYLGKLQCPRPRDVTLDVRLSRSILKTELQPLTLEQGFGLEWQNKKTL